MKRALILIPFALNALTSQAYAGEPTEKVPEVVITAKKNRALHMSFPYNEFSKTGKYRTMVEEMTLDSPGVGDSVGIYKGRDPNSSDSCYVIVHYSDDPAHPVHSVALLSSAKVEFQTASVNGSRIKVKATRQDWKELISSGESTLDPRMINSHVLAAMVFVDPQDVKDDGSYSGRWVHNLDDKNSDMTGSISKFLDKKNKRKILEITRNKGDLSTSTTLEFSSETNRLSEVSYVDSSQNYQLFNKDGVSFQRKLSAEEGRASSVHMCTDLSEPRKPKPVPRAQNWKYSDFSDAYEKAESFYFSESPISKKARKLIEGKKGNTGENSCDPAPDWAANVGDCSNLQTAINKQPSKPMKDDAETAPSSAAESSGDQTASQFK
jgi:hypothetical protein